MNEQKSAENQPSQVRIRIESGSVAIHVAGVASPQAKDNGQPSLSQALENFSFGTITWFVEALAKSASIRDIVLVYEGRLDGTTTWIVLDKVKATAVWVEKTSSWRHTRTDTTLPTTVDDPLADRIENLWVAMTCPRFQYQCLC